MGLNFTIRLGEKVAIAKQKRNQWINISELFKNTRGAYVDCLNNESSTLLYIDSDSNVEIIILPTKRVGITINSNYFIYADKLSITTLSNSRKTTFDCEGVETCL